MCRAGIRPEKQGTALGIFGAGNVGAAVTKFLAPFVMVAYGWQDGGAGLGASALAVMAVVFWFTTKDDPMLAERRRHAAQAAQRLAAQLAPLKNVQVWRFSLYYFFVFGAFVALALWLPRYLIGVYGLDIATAGMLGAAYLAPGQPLPRLWRPSVGPLRRAARHVLDLRLSSVAATFMLSYPPTDYVVAGRCTGRSRSDSRWASSPFIVTVFVLGFFMSLGKAAVFKHIPVYYPDHVGAVGGLVGMIGGLGGFVLPIAFGALQRPDRRLDELLHAAVRARRRRAGLDARRHPRTWSARPAARRSTSCPSCRRCRRSTGRSTSARSRGAVPSRTGGPRIRSSGRATGRAIARRNLLDLDPGAAAGLRGLDGLVGGRRQAARDRLRLHHRPAVLARRAARPLGRDAAHLLHLHGADLRRPALDDALDLRRC